MTIAVTAASGQLGRAVVRALRDLDPGRPLVGLARTPGRARALGVEVRPGDYADVGQLTRSLAGVDTMLLVSGNEPPHERVQQHRNVLAAARAAGVRKVVYTSVQGPEDGAAFAPVVLSNRQTEQDVRDSGLEWVIGRNGIYLEPDIESVDDYARRGEVANSAGDGRCGYTTRGELAHAYARLLTQPGQAGRVLDLHGEPITQTQLVDLINEAFGLRLVYRSMSVQDYRDDRVAELGEFIGSVIAGIYEGIRHGAFATGSDYAVAAGRPHVRWEDHFVSLAGGRAAAG